MKKILSICLIIFVLLISNISIASELKTIDVENMVSENQTIDENNDILLISENEADSNAMPISENNINSDIYLVQENIVIEENVFGNVYLIGDVVNIYSNKIDGNVFAIASDIAISENTEITGSVYLIGEYIEISGKLNDIYGITNSLELGEKINCREVKVVSEFVDVKGEISRNLSVIGDLVNIENNDFSKISGLLYCTGEVSGRDDKVGEIKKFENPFEIDQSLKTALAKATKKVTLVTACFTATVIMIIIIIFSNKENLFKTDIKEKFLSDTLFGLIYMIIIPIICILLLCTIIGIPLAMILLMIYIVLLDVFNLPIALMQIVKFGLKNKSESKLLLLGITIASFVIIEVIAYDFMIGSVVKTIISIYGLGFIVRKLLKRNKNSNKKNNEIIVEN